MSRGGVAFHLAWSLLATAAICLDTFTRVSTDPGAWVWPFGLVGYPLAAAIILIHRPGNGVGRVFAVIGATAGIFSFTFWAGLTWSDSPWTIYLELIGLPGFAVTYWGLVSLLFIFPTGETLPGWRRHFFKLFSVVALGVMSVLAFVSTETLEGGSGRRNPLYIVALDAGFGAALVVLGLGAVVGISTLVSRFRRSTGIERAQLKVFLTGATIFVVIAAIALGSPETETDNEPLWLNFVVAAAFLAPPAATAAAMLRYRLYDIDRIISRTVAYFLVVGMSAGVFLGLVVGIQALLPAQNNLAVAASTLAVAALFNPLRKRVQSIVDRRFNRSKYDAETEIDALAARLRDAHDIGGITAEMIRLVNKTVQPTSVGVWMAKGGS